jgi:hypothetical protein
MTEIPINFKNYINITLLLINFIIVCLENLLSSRGE